MKMRRIFSLIMICLLLQLSSYMSIPAAAATTLSITEPDNWEHISKSNPDSLKWSKVTGAAGYTVTVKNDATGEYYTQNEWTTKTSYSLKNLFNDALTASEYPRLKIWVGAMKSTDISQGLVALDAQDSIIAVVSEKPDVSLDSVTNITTGGATLTMTLSKDYGSAIIDSGFYVGTSSETTAMTKYSFSSYGTATTKGTKTMTITGLQSGTKYYARAYAENGVDEAESTPKSFTTKTTTVPLSVSTDNVIWDWDDGNGTDVVVTSSGTYTCQITYATTGLDTSGYNYQWLDYEIYNSTLWLYPTRGNYSNEARTAVVTISCGGESKKIAVTQGACEEGAPKIEIKQGKNPSSLSTVPNGTNWGNYSAEGTDTLYLYTGITNVRRVTVNIKKVGDLYSVNSKTFTPSTPTGDVACFMPVCAKNGDGLPAGEYQVDIWASNSATENDYWAQKPEKITMYFTIKGTHTHNYVMTSYEDTHPHKEYLICECGYVYFTGEERYVSSCSACNPNNGEGIVGVPTNMSDANKMVIYSTDNLPKDVIEGKVRHIPQVRTDPYYCADYWKSGGYDTSGSSGSLCTRAVYSMALSYLGVDCTPGKMAKLMETTGDIATVYYDQVTEKLQSEYPGLSLSNSGKLSELYENYANDKSFSPVYVRFGAYGDSVGHAALVIGRDPTNPNKYFCVEPSFSGDTKESVVHVVTMVVNSAETTATDYTWASCRGRSITACYQWRNTDVDSSKTPLSLSVNTINLSWGSANEGSVNVICNGDYSCMIDYDLPVAVTDTYDYAWLKYDISGNTITVSPLRENYSVNARSAEITVTCGNESETFTVTQEACEEDEPNITLKTYLTPTSEASPISNEYQLGTLYHGDIVENILYNLFAEYSNVRRISRNVRKINVNNAIDSISPPIEDAAGTIPLSYLPYDETGAKLSPGDYYVDVWASNSPVENDYWAQKIKKTIYFNVSGSESSDSEDKKEDNVTDYSLLEESFINLAKDDIIDEHEDYVLKALKYHLENSDDVKTALQKGESAVFIFDGCHPNLIGCEFAEDGFINYYKSDKKLKLNRSAVCLLIRLNAKGNAEIIFACTASTTADEVRGTNENGKGRPVTIDGIYDLVTVNHLDSYAALKLQNFDVIRCTEKISTIVDGDGNGIHAHARKNWYIPGTPHDSTGCILIGRSVFNPDNSNDYNDFMELTTGQANALNTKFTTSKTVGVMVMDRTCYLEALPIVFGNDAVAGGLGRSGRAHGNHIAAKITNESIFWRSEIMGELDPVVQLWNSYNSYVWYLSGAFSVSYDSNGGQSAPDTTMVTKNSVISISDVKPTRSGYTFLGWDTSADATTAEYQAGDSYTVTGGVTFYAVWQKNGSSGGSGGGSSTPAEKYTLNLVNSSGSSATVSVANNTGSKVSARLLIAAYDSSNKMISCNVAEKTWNNGTNAEIALTCGHRISYVKVFILDINTNAPLFKSWQKTL